MTAVTDLTAWERIRDGARTGAPAVFLDRDGTVIENVPYLDCPDGVCLIDGAREAIRACRAQGYAIVIVTNQSGVARGLLTADQYRAVEERVLDCIGADLVDGVYACPFHPAGAGAFAADHPWRKPAAGMLEAARTRLSIDMRNSIMVGDSLSDMQAGAAAGVRRLVHVLTGHGLAEREAVAGFVAGIAAPAWSMDYLPSIAQLSPERCVA